MVFKLFLGILIKRNNVRRISNYHLTHTPPKCHSGNGNSNAGTEVFGVLNTIKPIVTGFINWLIFIRNST